MTVNRTRVYSAVTPHCFGCHAAVSVYTSSAAILAAVALPVHVACFYHSNSSSPSDSISKSGHDVL
jgi:hypothetical protein